MKYCMYCGAQLPDEARFCAVCGKPVGEAGKSQISVSTSTTAVQEPVPAKVAQETPAAEPKETKVLEQQQNPEEKPINEGATKPSFVFGIVACTLASIAITITLSDSILSTVLSFLMSFVAIPFSIISLAKAKSRYIVVFKILCVVFGITALILIVASWIFAIASVANAVNDAMNEGGIGFIRLLVK